MKQVNIITVILFAFLFISCQNKKLSKIESRTRFLIQKSTEKENCSISYDSCVFQNDSICIVDYIIIKLLYRVNIYRHTLYVIGHGCYSFITQ